MYKRQDFTRFHSNAGYITNVYYHALTDMGANVDIMPALGTHEPMTREQCEKMLGDVPFEKLIAHDWRHDVVKIGEVPGEFISSITDGLWKDCLLYTSAAKVAAVEPAAYEAHA